MYSKLHFISFSHSWTWILASWINYLSFSLLFWINVSHNDVVEDHWISTLIVFIFICLEKISFFFGQNLFFLIELTIQWIHQAKRKNVIGIVIKSSFSHRYKLTLSKYSFLPILSPCSNGHVPSISFISSNILPNNTVLPRKSLVVANSKKKRKKMKCRFVFFFPFISSMALFCKHHWFWNRCAW